MDAGDVYGEKTGRGFLAASVIASVVATTAVVLRLYARFFVVRRGGVDDVLVSVAWVFAVCGTVALNLLVYTYGYDKDLYPLMSERTVSHQKLIYAWHPIRIVTLSLVKISVILFYKRLLAHSNNKLVHWILIGIMAFVAVFTVASLLAGFFICTPAAAYWDQFAPGRAGDDDDGGEFRCGEGDTLILAVGYLNLVTDFTVTLVPLTFIHTLRMDARRKMSLAVLFSLGFLVCATTTTRQIFVHLLERSEQPAESALKSDRGRFFPDLLNPSRRDGPAYWVALLSVLETNVAIVCASAPALKSLFSGQSRRTSRRTRATATAIAIAAAGTVGGGLAERTGSKDDGDGDLNGKSARGFPKADEVSLADLDPAGKRVESESESEGCESGSESGLRYLPGLEVLVERTVSVESVRLDDPCYGAGFSSKRDCEM